MKSPGDNQALSELGGGSFRARATAIAGTTAYLKDAWTQFIPSRSLVEVSPTQLRDGVVGKIDTSDRLGNAVRLQRAVFRSKP